MSLFTTQRRVQSHCREWAALFPLFLPLASVACEDADKSTTTDTATHATDDIDAEDTGIEAVETEPDCDPVVYEPYPFITKVISVNYGEGAGFGQESFPDIVLGSPIGYGEYRGSLDVLTLGEGGSITVTFDVLIQDGDGPDVIVFENPFVGWLETGVVSASVDGENWYTWECDPLDADNNFPGCAGVTPTMSHPDNCIDARDPLLAGGDAFDLADIELTEAKFIRVTDSGTNTLGGFDLDAIAIIHGQSVND